MADPFDTPGYRYALNKFPGDGATTEWNIDFAGNTPGYISTDHVRASLVNETTGVETPLVLTPSNWILPTRLSVTPAVPVGTTLYVRRNTPKDEPMLDYTDGSLMVEKNLDTSNEQNIYGVAEMVDRFADTLDDIADFSQAMLDRLADVENTANTADDKADTAINTSNTAVSIANSAVALANQAIDTADDAVAAVAGAEAAAIAATNAANAANTAATNANAAATAATSTAAAALDTAEDAVTIANGATGTANNALSVANGIAATAQEALDTAEAAETTANGIAATANEALDTANDAEATANSFEARVSAMEPRVNPILLPTTTHNLDDYRTRGLFMQNATAGAVAGGASYPVPFAGTLVVTSAPGMASNLLYQEYTVYGNDSSPAVVGGRTYKRSCQNQISGTWSTWKEVARKNEVMSHVFLTAATNANTLVADNTWWTWTSGTVSGGGNFPPGPTTSSGVFFAYPLSASYVVQECVLTPSSTRRPVKYRRIGNGVSTWSTWAVVDPISATTDLPTSNCGDVYVDGIGLHSFIGGAYSPNRLPPRHRSGGVMSLGAASPTRILTIQPFQLRSDDDTVDLVMTGSLNKVFQASGDWSAGNNGNIIVSGGTGALTLFDVYAIRNNTTGAIDVCATTSGDTLTPPTGWGRARLLGTIYFLTGTSTICNFIQAGNRFLLAGGVLVVENGSLTANTPVQVNTIVPQGRRVHARLMAHGGAGTPATNFTVYPGDLAQTYGGVYNQVADSSVTGGRSAQIDVLTNTSRQVTLATTITFSGGMYLASQGWTELEGW